jgi:hypothetical protein
MNENGSRKFVVGVGGHRPVVEEMYAVLEMRTNGASSERRFASVGACDMERPMSQRSQILLKLREMILTGRFHPGERLAEVRVASELGVSRTPVRAAL